MNNNVIQKLYDATTQVQNTIEQKLEDQLRIYFEEDSTNGEFVLKPKMLNFKIGEKVVKVPKFSLVEHPLMSVSEVKVKLKSNIKEVTNDLGNQEQQCCDSNHVDIELTFNNSNKSTGFDQLMKDYDKTY
ncbi:MAG: hypothetical protein CMF62_00825 [Magnetococcales bacterium]|nr:hypothetical protein [Magnetococcales bacterium]|tara:strand:+ start:3159 stop:3548 length:390 start_codon:yes stop_codon:yes gene_type:complete